MLRTNDQFGKVVRNKVLPHATSLGTRIVQCTIRDDNGARKGLFAKCIHKARILIKA